MKNDSLTQGAILVHRKEAKRKASETTRHKHLIQAKRIVKRIRKIGFGVKEWKNINNKQVAALVKSWVEEGISAKTIKNYLSTIRRLTRFFGNYKVHKDNKAFGITTKPGEKKDDLSVSIEEFNRIIKTLGIGVKEYDFRFLAMYRLQRFLGLRTEESYKFNPRQSVLPDGKLWICHGTKGGRERTLDEISPEGKMAIKYALRIMGKNRNLIPKTPGMTERKWQKLYYNRMAEVGATRKEAGAGGHGNRHAYAQSRYEQITLFAPPCKFESVKTFVENAREIAGDDWKKRDEAARTVIRGLMGHGPYRNDVTSQYLGSRGRAE